MIPRKASLAVLACALLFGGPVAAELARPDAEFLRQAAQNGHAEVESSRLAQNKASAPQVKSFAEQMVADHTKSGEELKALAQSKGVQVPTGPSEKQKAQIRKLEAAEGARFDQQYASEMGVAAHEQTVRLFRRGASQAKDPEVKAFAERTLPTLEHHLALAKELKTAVDQGQP
jgi:putative membrane protein